MLEFSVIMSVYQGNSPDYLETAIDSIYQQTRKPKETVLVVDGPINHALDNILEKKQEKYQNIKIIRLEQNNGLAHAMQVAVKHASTPYLARMDSDDICLPDRFEKQMQCFEEDPNLSIVGGMITEFEGNPENIISKRIVPLNDADIKEFMRGRCGINHVTAIIKKEDLLRAGNYQTSYLQEDHYLWARMMLAGCTFKNIPDIVVNVRSGRDQFARRGGWKFFKSEVQLFWFMHKNKLISFSYFLYICLIRCIVRFLMPNWLRTWVYQTFLRKK